MTRTFLLFSALVVAALLTGVLGTGCPPADDEVLEVIGKALAKDGCRGCDGCEAEEGEGEGTPVLQVTPAALSYDWSGGILTVDIQTTASWTAHADESWVSLNRSSGTGAAALTVYCFGNGGAARTATVTVIGIGTDPASAAITVNQAALPAEGESEGESVEGEGPGEGEGAVEGESPAEGEGETPAEGEDYPLPVELISLATGTFVMGRTPAGDDATYGTLSEDPKHPVVLGDYQIGKFEVTNREYCDMLNWALVRGYLYSDTSGTPWAGEGNIYAGDAPQARYLIVSFSSGDCNIRTSSGRFSSKVRVGMPPSPYPTTIYSMDNHPVVCVSWYGAAAYCNWLSRRQGLTPCYDMATPEWPLTVPPPRPGGYRLPTEAEWECAAAWDGVNHWTYGFLSDTNSGPESKTRCNIYWHDGEEGSFVNPLGLLLPPFTSPVGWFNGESISPNGNIATVDSPSPAGAYDMSGNVWEWCHDWYAAYDGNGQLNPVGPTVGLGRIARGGSWFAVYYGTRTALRANNPPETAGGTIGFRVARSYPSPLMEP